jgi:gamma-glutamyltranspeptidase/glutathione hydrolase
MVAHLRAKGGLHTLADFAGARGEYVTPISTSYRGFEVHQVPPNNQGLTALLMLNILEGFDFSKLEPLSAQRLHYEIEAGRMAYAMRDQLIADMALAKVDVAGILDKQFAGKLRSQIRAGEAMAGLPPMDVAKSDTVYLCVADGQRNVVSFINSIYHSFGSGIVAPGTGVLLQNRGMGFSLAAGHPNCIAPGKRPLHTIMPGMVTLEGRPAMAYGVMGGDYQPFGHVHFLQNVIDFGLNPQAALDLPRVFAAHQKVEVEAGVPEDVFKALGHLGHDAARALGPLGGGQAILIDHEAGTVTAGSDPRKDGAAAGL